MYTIVSNSIIKDLINLFNVIFKEEIEFKCNINEKSHHAWSKCTVGWLN